MKKLLAILLCVALLCGVAVMNVSAAEATENHSAVFMEDVDTLYWYAYWTSRYFTAETGPSADLAWEVVTSLDYLDFEEYELEVYEEDPYVTHRIPKDVFEAALAKRFVVTDALLAEIQADASHYDAGTEEYYILGGGYGDLMPSWLYQGYQTVDEDTFIVYGYMGMNYTETGLDYATYVPSGDEVEGVDYILVEESGEIEGIVLALQEAYKLCGAIATTVNYSGDKVQFVAHKLLTTAEMPAADTLTGVAEPTETPAVKVEIGEAFDNIPTAVIGVAVTEELAEDSMDMTAVLDRVETAMTDISEKYTVYEFVAMDMETGDTVQPTGKVKVSLAIPEDYSDSVAVFYVDEDGKAEKLETTVDKETRIATVELSHFSTYVLAEVEPEPVAPPTDDNKDEGSNPSTDNNDNKGETNPSVDDNKDEEPESNNQKAPVVSVQTGDSPVMAIVAGVVLVLCAAVLVLVLLRKRSTK